MKRSSVSMYILYFLEFWAMSIAIILLFNLCDQYSIVFVRADKTNTFRE